MHVKPHATKNAGVAVVLYISHALAKQHLLFSTFVDESFVRKHSARMSTSWVLLGSFSCLSFLTRSVIYSEYEVIRMSFPCIGAAVMSIKFHTTQIKQTTHTHGHQVCSGVGVFNKHESLEQSDVENHASLVSFSLEYFRDATTSINIIFLSYSYCTVLLRYL